MQERLPFVVPQGATGTLDCSREDSYLWTTAKQTRGRDWHTRKKITIYQERRQQRGTEDRIKKDSAVKEVALF